VDDGLTTLIYYSLGIIIFAWMGGAIPLIFRKRSLIIHLFISFGAGILLGAAFLRMIPEAAEYIGNKLGIPILLGFLTLYIFEKFVMTHPCPSEKCEYHTVGITAFIGLSLHSLVTGLALGSGILVPKLGLIVFLAILLHKLPASMALSSLLIKEHYSIRNITLTILLFSLMVPLGAFLTYFLVERASSTTIGYLVAFSAGTFLHVAADDLLPEVHRHFSFRELRLFIFLFGILVIGSINLIQ